MPNPAELVDAGLPNSARYDANTTGVIIDKVTNLWWQQPIKTTNGAGASCANGCTRDAAIQYCAGLTLAGHTDWRLPTRIELVSLVDYAQTGPAINRSYFMGTPNALFWTSSLVVGLAVGDAGVGWDVDFTRGNTHGDVATTSGQVRCVR